MQPCKNIDIVTMLLHALDLIAYVAMKYNLINFKILVSKNILTLKKLNTILDGGVKCISEFLNID